MSHATIVLLVLFVTAACRPPHLVVPAFRAGRPVDAIVPVEIRFSIR